MHRNNWKKVKSLIYSSHYNFHVFPFVTKQLLIKLMVLHPWVMPWIELRHTGFTNMQKKPFVCLGCRSQGFCGRGSRDCGSPTILWKSHFPPERDWRVKKKILRTFNIIILLRNMIKFSKTRIKPVLHIVVQYFFEKGILWSGPNLAY